MNNLILFSILGFVLQGDFATFSFCRDALGGSGEQQCIVLDDAGSGTFKITPVDADTETVAIELSDFGVARFRELVSETRYLEEADDYDSGREVLSVGLKTLTLERGGDRRRASFYVTTNPEAMALAAFCDGLIAQEMILIDIESALQFDPLGIPERLDFIERDLERDRLADAPRLIPILERIAGDSRVVNYARMTASRLKAEIEDRY